jgi:hypothetical protein
MIHLSGTFVYQRSGNVGVRAGEIQPPAFYISLVLRDDDGTPTYPNDSKLDIVATVMLSRPQQLFSTGFDGYLLDLTLDFIQQGYLGFTATIDPSYGTPPPDWLPLGILIWAHGLPVGIITAAPYPIADTGIAPPQESVSGNRGSVAF